jgi:hypothetical protein
VLLVDTLLKAAFGTTAYNRHVNFFSRSVHAVIQPCHSRELLPANEFEEGMYARFSSPAIFTTAQPH